MTPKQKAVELVNKFKEFSDEDYSDVKIQFELNETRKQNAKDCAIILCDEILNLRLVIKSPEDETFWENVKYDIGYL